eukprot:217066_1
MLLLLLLYIGAIHLVYGDSFTITNETWKNSNGPDILLKRLTNTNTNESVLIIYSPGGRLEQINLRSQSKQKNPISVISGHNGNASAVYENAHYKGCPLMPWANRIANSTYTFFGKTYKVPVNEPARNDALHGFMVNNTFTVENETITSKHAELKLSITFSKELNNLYPGYPFEFTVWIYYRLNSSGVFSIHIEAENIGSVSDEALPFYLGWHPYFNVENISQSMIELDPNCKYINLNCGSPPQTAPLIPTGYSKPWKQFNGKNPIGVAQGNTQGMPTYYDDAYRVIRNKEGNELIRNKIIDPLRDNTFVLYQEQNKFRFNQLYTGIAYQTGEQAIAFEPQSGSTNAYNNGDDLTVLYPGERYSADFGFYVE